VTGRRKGGLPRCTACQNPHNHQVAAVFDFAVRLASHPFLHPLSFSDHFRVLWQQRLEAEPDSPLTLMRPVDGAKKRRQHKIFVYNRKFCIFVKIFGYGRKICSTGEI